MPPKAVMPIPVRGVIYENAHHAARELGVSLSRVYEAACRGTTDRLGVGRGRHAKHRSGRSKPLRLGPYAFASYSEAARALKVSRKTIVRARHDPKTRDRLMSKVMSLSAMPGYAPSA